MEPVPPTQTPRDVVCAPTLPAVGVEIDLDRILDKIPQQGDKTTLLKY